MKARPFMKAGNESELFLSKYPSNIFVIALALRKLLLSSLPGITEQTDIPAKMIAYCYGQKYSEMICTIIPSQKEIKLGFYKGNELPDPSGLLEGKGKISRYIVIRSVEKIAEPAVADIIAIALTAYQQRI